MGAAPPELASIFPLGACPMLEVHDPNIPTYPKQGVMAEAGLILKLLAEKYGNGAWTPEEPADKLRNAFWQEFSSATLQDNIAAITACETIPLVVPWLLRPLVRVFCKFYDRLSNTYDGSS